MFKILIMEKVIWKFFTPILDDVNHRYKSWEHCYNAFDNKNESNNNLSLNLGFYFILIILIIKNFGQAILKKTKNKVHPSFNIPIIRNFIRS